MTTPLNYMPMSPAIKDAGDAARARLQAALTRSHSQHVQRMRKDWQRRQPTPAERAAQFQADTDRMLYPATTSTPYTTPSTRDLPTPTAEIDIPEPPGPLEAVGYVLAAWAAIAVISIGLGYVFRVTGVFVK